METRLSLNLPIVIGGIVRDIGTKPFVIYLILSGNNLLNNLSSFVIVEIFLGFCIIYK